MMKQLKKKKKARIEKQADKMGVKMKAETNGSGGIKTI